MILYMPWIFSRQNECESELPAEGLKKLAPNKKPKNLIQPIQQIQRGIQTQRIALGKDSRMEQAKGKSIFVE